jgi:hypothetical protein
MISNRKGPLNAAMAVLLALKNKLPGLITTANTSDHASVWIAFDSITTATTKTLILDDVTVSIVAGTYAPTTLKTLLNLDTGFSATMLATAPYSHVLCIALKSDANNSITIGDGTINSNIGLTNGQISSYMDLRVPAWYKIQDPEGGDAPPAYPALMVSVPSISPRNDDEWVDYNIEIMYIETHKPGSNSIEVLTYQLLKIYELIIGVFESDRTCGGMVNNINIIAGELDAPIDTNGVLYRKRLIITLAVEVEED